MARTFPTSLHRPRPTEKLALIVALAALAASATMWVVSAGPNVSLGGTRPARAAARLGGGLAHASAAFASGQAATAPAAASSTEIAGRIPPRNEEPHVAAARRTEAGTPDAVAPASGARIQLRTRAPIRLAVPRTRTTARSAPTTRPTETAPRASGFAALLASGSRDARAPVAATTTTTRVVPQMEVRAAFRALAASVARCPRAAAGESLVVTLSLDGERGTARRTSALDFADARTLRCVDASIAGMPVPVFSGSPLVVRYRLPIAD